MTTRRQFLALLGLTSVTATGCTRMTAKNIEDMPREYALLMDPVKRRAALGDQRLKVSGADIGVGGTDFYEKVWESIHFYDCIFYGVIHLSLIRNCVFEHCQFPGTNFQAYAMEDVLFMCSDTIGEAYLMNAGGKNVRFVECDFGGKNPDPNHQGSIYMDSEVSYERCTGQYMDVSGTGIVSYRDCKFDSVYMSNGTFRKDKWYYATVTIDNCTFKGGTRMQRSSMTNLAIRNSKFDILEIGESDVQGDVVIDGVQAGAMIDQFANARSITIRNCRFRGVNISPEGYETYYRSLDCTVSSENRKNLRSVVLEKVECGRDDFGIGELVDGKLSDKATGCQIMGGYDSTVMRNCAIPNASLMLESVSALIEKYEGEKATFASSKIGSLTFRDTAIAKAIDFSGVQVQKFDASGLVRYTGQQIVTKDSNIHL